MTTKTLPRTPVELPFIPGSWCDAPELPTLRGFVRPFRKEDFASPCFTVFRGCDNRYICLDLLLEPTRILNIRGHRCETILNLDVWPLGSTSGYQRFTPDVPTREFLQGYFNKLFELKFPNKPVPFHPYPMVLHHNTYKSGEAFAVKINGDSNDR